MPPSPLRVLFVNRMACLERGGGETFDLEISRCLSTMGVQITYLSGAPLFSAPPLPLPDATCLHTPWLRRFPWDKVRGGWRVRQAEFDYFQWRAARWIARHPDRWDIIQICELPELVCHLKHKKFPAPLVMRLTAPNYYDPHGGVEKADALIASGTSIQKMRDSGLTRVHDIPNAVDPDLFKPQPSTFRATHDIPPTDFTAVYAARFQAFKNHDMLLRSFALVLKEHPTARLVLAGDGPLRPRCEALAADLGIASRVHFLGAVPYPALPAILAAADLAVVSSDYESFCFFAIEAMSTSLPVLTTDCGWVPRLISDGAGVVVPTGDPAPFATAWLRLATDAPLRHRLGTTARSLVLTRHTWTSSAQKLLALYQSLLPASGPSASSPVIRKFS